jgi:putative hydrolase of HD superfamily
MEHKAQNNNLEKIFNFFLEIGKLKTTYRYGASENMQGDSSADHSWRLALMSFIIADELKLRINKAHAMEIALVHDLAEAITGDIDVRLIKEKKITKKEKNEMELKAMEKIKNTLPKHTGYKIYNLWQEYENAASNEAKFIKALDKIETITHLIGEGYKKYDDTELIAIYADDYVDKFPKLKKLLKTVKIKLKEEFKKGKFEWKSEYNKHL